MVCIFELYRDGHSLLGVAELLNVDGVPDGAYQAESVIFPFALTPKSKSPGTF